jgi:Na+-driven multidrug efflux pump
LFATLLPELWVGLFSRDPAVIDIGVQYLHRVAPFYALYGVGMSLYFSSQGAGRMLWPFLAGIGRLVAIMVIGGYWITAMRGSIAGLFWISAASMIFFALVILAAFGSGYAWRTLRK